MDTQQKSLFECWFKLSENHTNVRTEILAGFTTFLTMCYIIIVNPRYYRLQAWILAQYLQQRAFHLLLGALLWVH